MLELESREPLSYAYGLGHTGVTYLGASGKVMLAHMTAQEIAQHLLAVATCLMRT